MAQVLVWCDAVPDHLLEFLYVGKPSSLGSGPDGIIADTNLENTSRAGYERKLADFRRESR